MKTVKIVRPECPGGYCVINETDFDAKKMKLYKEPKPKPVSDGAELEVVQND